MRLYRRPVAWALLLALLFAQMATAVYACTTESNTAVESARLVASASTNCEGMQMAVVGPATSDSPLCADHCTHATDATANAHSAVLHWEPVLVLRLTTVAPVLRDVDQLVAWSGSPSIAHAVEPPIPIFLGRFLS